ncbi:MAG: bifunctional UDP-N-acetylglucosamine diphosphorylase/glucosamine-1-phosphate N-acetyltransferase GlmU [Defluviitaleaceae bacterium]|nr:bifunctional UDP-N-acetylglucosamine diphosphorylase/glucosamine-1-phosphate N-acetyltransferase GlmU [Defluviitaleaceae bacterium]
MKAIILAAGAGTRMKSNLPKVLHTVTGKPMLHYVIEACQNADITDITVVISKNGEPVKTATPHSVKFVEQAEQLGTGHAVLCAKDNIDPNDQVVILCGDTPLITSAFLRKLFAFQETQEAHAVVVATKVPDPAGYGRITTSPNGDFAAIVEHKDLSATQRNITDINTGIFLATGSELLYGLARLENHNYQNEYYLTDVPKILKSTGYNVAVYNAPNYSEFLGVNSQKQLETAATVLRQRIIDKHFENGVQIIDSTAVYIDAAVEIAAGVTIYPGTMLQGNSKIAENATIGPYSQVINSNIGKATTVRNSVLENATVGENCQLGPFAYLRPGTVIGDHCRIGDFVEVKNATIGNNTNAAHLAYIGDAQVGEGVNFGCGAITVNYDGVTKNTTIVEDNAFIGSNVNLIAPVTVHSGAFVAAGSTITSEVPKNALAIARERQVNKKGFAAKYKKLKTPPKSKAKQNKAIKENKESKINP